ncbi:hypothetical protein [Salinivibrio sp. PR919]|nr:hypothetical protein [Salinivibrio sp. PR919]
MPFAIPLGYAAVAATAGGLGLWFGSELSKKLWLFLLLAALYYLYQNK